MNSKHLTLSLALLSSSLGLWAQQERALPILSQGQEAASVAMGGNHYGESHHLYLYGNPTSALYQKGHFEAGLYYHSQNLKDENQSTLTGLGGATTWRQGRHAWMLGTRYYGGLRQADISSNESQRRTRLLYDQTVDVAYALRTGAFSFYAMGSYIATNQMRGVATYAASLGLSYRNSFRWQDKDLHYVLTAKGSNFGPSFSYLKKGSRVQPPSAVGLGAEVSHAGSLHGVKANLSAEHFLTPSEAASTRLQVGAEYAYRQMAMLRAGYFHDTNGLSALSLGLGARYKMLRTDVSLVLPNNQNISPQVALSLGVAF
ncbi:MAG: PorV/PorQ family protein [Bacteroidales bacterium]|nr:PorV/PorQ family protein [Bacteroidales bacterium]